jgi:nicotinamidase-related amidase
LETDLATATIIIDMQVDFFLPHPRLTQHRSKLTVNINALAVIARRNASPVIWVTQVFAADLHDAPLEVRKGGHRVVI